MQLANAGAAFKNLSLSQGQIMEKLPAQMTVIGISRPGGPEVLLPETRALPTPGSGEILWDITVNGAKVGTARRLKLDAPVWAKPAFGLEINLEAAEQTPAKHKTYRAIPATPRVQVDLALLAPISVTAAQMDAVIRREAGELLESLTLFDEFVGQGIQEGSRSLAWALTFRDAERTLKDQEVQGRTAKIVKALEGELGVRQRTA